jgi:hypothetical protein
MSGLFKEGGPHRIRKTGPDEYSMSIEIPMDTDGLVGRKCPEESCSPGYFKVKPGTGITDGQEEAFCPYCRNSDSAGKFLTKAQLQYAKDLMFREVHKGISGMLEKSLGLGPSRKKRYGDGFLSMELSFEPGRLPSVRPPVEEELRRDLTCPRCGLEHAVFGLAVWCPDCGADIFITHVEREFSVVTQMLEDLDRRYEVLGSRIAARDIENALEDTVSIFEAALRAMTKRYLRRLGHPEEEIMEILRKRIGNRYQNIGLAAEVGERELKIRLFEGIDDGDVETLRQTFEKRHPITHNLGVVDRKYLDKVRSGELEGREVRVTVKEIEKAMSICTEALRNLHLRLFP